MSAPDDSNLVCPVCEYNLTGLPENRCPECGTAFDPDDLRHVAAGGVLPVLPETDLPPWAYVCRIWWMSLFHPRQFARGFPMRHDTARAVLYSLACYVLATGTFCALAILFAEAKSFSRRDLSLFASCAMLGGVPACALCEFVNAAILATLLSPLRARDRYHFWRGLTHYTSGFTLLTGLWGGAALTQNLNWHSVMICEEPIGQLLYLLAALVFSWWIMSLGTMVRTRSRSGLCQWTALVLIPIVGAGAIVAGVCLSVFWGTLFV